MNITKLTHRLEVVPPVKNESCCPKCLLKSMRNCFLVLDVLTGSEECKGALRRADQWEECTRENIKPYKIVKPNGSEYIYTVKLLLESEDKFVLIDKFGKDSVECFMYFKIKV